MLRDGVSGIRKHAVSSKCHDPVWWNTYVIRCPNKTTATCNHNLFNQAEEFDSTVFTVDISHVDGDQVAFGTAMSRQGNK